MLPPPTELGMSAPSTAIGGMAEPAPSGPSGSATTDPTVGTQEWYMDQQAREEGTDIREKRDRVFRQSDSLRSLGMVSGHGQPISTVWVGQIPEPLASETGLRQLFSSYGTVRRIIVRKKEFPAFSWCLLTFADWHSAEKCIENPPLVEINGEVSVSDGLTDGLTDGKTIRLLVEPPSIEEELQKETTGALDDVVLQVLHGANAGGTAAGATDASDESVAEETGNNGKPKKARRKRWPSRRCSNTELMIRGAISCPDTVSKVGSTDEWEDSTALDLLPDGVRTGRQMWSKVRSRSFRIRLQMAKVFTPQNDDKNAKEAKQAIERLLAAAKKSEPAITSKLRAVVSLHGGDLVGLDFRFKSEASLFRKTMSRLDSAIRESTLSSKLAPTADDILKSILDVLRCDGHLRPIPPPGPPRPSPPEGFRRVYRAVAVMPCALHPLPCRYTAVFTTEKYTKAVTAMVGLPPSVRKLAVPSELASHGFTPLRVKNFWGRTSILTCPAGLSNQRHCRLCVRG